MALVYLARPSTISVKSKSLILMTIPFGSFSTSEMPWWIEMMTLRFLGFLLIIVDNPMVVGVSLPCKSWLLPHLRQAETPPLEVVWQHEGLGGPAPFQPAGPQRLSVESRGAFPHGGQVFPGGYHKLSSPQLLVPWRQWW
jgi:hypothetical protein